MRGVWRVHKAVGSAASALSFSNAQLFWGKKNREVDFASIRRWRFNHGLAQHLDRCRLRCTLLLALLRCVFVELYYYYYSVCMRSLSDGNYVILVNF